MRIIETKVYTFDELNDKAKSVARDWYRNGFDYSDVVEYEPFETAAALMGIEFDNPRGQGSDIQYSGFSSQGDGASFTGKWSYYANSPAIIRDEFGTDEKLHKVVDRLAALQAQHGNQLFATIERSRGNYVHSNMMDVDVVRVDGDEQFDVTEETRKEVQDALRSFADWIYSSLMDDYDYQTSDAAVDEMIVVNEYEFTEAGKRCVAVK